MTENSKFRKAILSAFYNISQRNFGILLILWCSFKLWWNFCLDQNLVYNANGPLAVTRSWLAVLNAFNTIMYFLSWNTRQPFILLKGYGNSRNIQYIYFYFIWKNFQNHTQISFTVYSHLAYSSWNIFT
jgi:hypothetical protein